MEKAVAEEVVAEEVVAEDVSTRDIAAGSAGSAKRASALRRDTAAAAAAPRLPRRRAGEARSRVRALVRERE
ncbi:hypothetical protein [Streptomyces sp. NPDC058657]|uniref:hypothetical protein n=1 Tax=unclassified Streptomyces TaxID=2593676 RepID=UPI00366A0750